MGGCSSWCWTSSWSTITVWSARASESCSTEIRRSAVVGEAASGEEAIYLGPSPDGACPFVGIGDVVPCAGDTLVLARPPGAPPYTVPSQMTLCPCTVAAALAVPADWDLLTA